MANMNKYNQQIIDIYKNIKKIANKFPGRLIDVLDCFNQNQFDCKTWLIDCLNQYPYHFKMKTKDSIDIAILGGWYGLMAKIVSDHFSIKPIRHIYSYDYDPYAGQVGRILFPSIEFVEKNVKDLNIADKSFSIVINTSCEHMEQDLLADTIQKSPEHTLFVLQSNDYVEVSQHINCVESLDSFVKQYDHLLNNIRSFEKDMGKYKRFMIMGTKK